MNRHPLSLKGGATCFLMVYHTILSLILKYHFCASSSRELSVCAIFTCFTTLFSILSDCDDKTTTTLNIKIPFQISLYCVLLANITRYSSILFVTFDLLLHHRSLPFFLHQSWPNYFLSWKILLMSIFLYTGVQKKS